MTTAGIVSTRRQGVLTGRDTILCLPDGSLDFVQGDIIDGIPNGIHFWEKKI